MRERGYTVSPQKRLFFALPSFAQCFSPNPSRCFLFFLYFGCFPMTILTEETQIGHTIRETKSQHDQPVNKPNLLLRYRFQSTSEADRDGIHEMHRQQSPSPFGMDKHFRSTSHPFIDPICSTWVIYFPTTRPRKPFSSASFFFYGNNIILNKLETRDSGNRYSRRC